MFTRHHAHIHEAYGLKSRQWQSFYHFNVGG